MLAGGAVVTGRICENGSVPGAAKALRRLAAGELDSDEVISCCAEKNASEVTITQAVEAM